MVLDAHLQDPANSRTRTVQTAALYKCQILLRAILAQAVHATCVHILFNHTGAPLVLTGPKSIRIKSQPITMEIPDGGITSEFANNVTDKQWNAYRGMKDDHFPEVPPDGEPCRNCSCLGANKPAIRANSFTLPAS